MTKENHKAPKNEPGGQFWKIVLHLMSITLALRHASEQPFSQLLLTDLYLSHWWVFSFQQNPVRSLHLLSPVGKKEVKNLEQNERRRKKSCWQVTSYLYHTVTVLTFVQICILSSEQQKKTQWKLKLVKEHHFSKRRSLWYELKGHSQRKRSWLQNQCKKSNYSQKICFWQ